MPSVNINPKDKTASRITIFAMAKMKRDAGSSSEILLRQTVVRGETNVLANYLARKRFLRRYVWHEISVLCRQI
jgi:hypothetical protein